MPADASPPRVAVLMSTFNGAAFLGEQLDSLWAQTGVAVSLFVRDDGSTDSTLDILAKHAARWPLTIANDDGRSLGPAPSFIGLLRDAPAGFDAYAFCDQDDVWLPEKLAAATDRLAQVPVGVPALYCSRVRLVDEELRPLGESRLDPDGRFEHLLFENIAYGNTVVMNAAAWSLVISSPPRAGLVMHDWWCALVVSAVGQVIYDEVPRVLYRQHRRNVVGGTANRLGEIATHLRNLIRDPGRFYPIRDQAAEFLRRFGASIPPDRLALANALVASRVSLAARVRFAVTGPVIRARWLDAMASRLLLAAGR